MRDAAYGAVSARPRKTRGRMRAQDHATAGGDLSGKVEADDGRDDETCVSEMIRG